jgi:hypothetical protein
MPWETSDDRRQPITDDPKPVEGQRVIRASEFMREVIMKSRTDREMKLHFFGWPIVVNSQLPQNVICLQPSEDPDSWKWFRFHGEKFIEFKWPNPNRSVSKS